MLSKTEVDQKFSALKEHGEEVASKFKEFVQHLDQMLPDGLSKTKFVNELESASKWAHTALADAEAAAKNALHQREKSGVKPVDPAEDSKPSTVTQVTKEDAVSPKK